MKQRILTRTNDELMHCLTQCVRLLTRQQADVLRAAERLRKLASQGLVIQQHVFCAPALPLEAPLASWAPGEAPPDAAQLSYQAQSRWNSPGRWTTAYVASVRGAKLFGGRGGRLKNPLQATHDAHVTEVLLRLRRDNPALAASWVGEDVMGDFLTFAGGRRPDAVVLTPAGTVRLAIEFVGSYPPARIATFHRECAQRGWRYEIW